MKANIAANWTDMVRSMTRFVVMIKGEKNYRQLERLQLFNQWIRWSGFVTDTDTAIWALDCINNLADVPVGVLRQAIEFDQSYTMQ